MSDIKIIDTPSNDTLLDLVNHICSKNSIDEAHKNFRVNFYSKMLDDNALSSKYTIYAGGDPQVIDNELEAVNKLADSIYFGIEKMEGKGKLSDAVILRWSSINILRTRSVNFQGSIRM